MSDSYIALYYYIPKMAMAKFAISKCWKEVAQMYQITISPLTNLQTQWVYLFPDWAGVQTDFVAMEPELVQPRQSAGHSIGWYAIIILLIMIIMLLMMINLLMIHHRWWKTSRSIPPIKHFIFSFLNSWTLLRQKYFHNVWMLLQNQHPNFIWNYYLGQRVVIRIY